MEAERPLVERIHIFGRKLSQMISESPIQLRDCNIYIIHSTPMDWILTFIQMSSKALFLASLPHHPSSLSQTVFIKNCFCFRLLFILASSSFSTTLFSFLLLAWLWGPLFYALTTFLTVNYICPYWFASPRPTQTRGTQARDTSRGDLEA